MAGTGQLQPLTMPECLPVSGRSRPAHVQISPRLRRSRRFSL